jgi:hypothetical protein
VGGIGEELPGLSFRAAGLAGRHLGVPGGSLSPDLGGLQSIQHAVECGRGAAELSVGPVWPQPAASVAGGDLSGQRGEPVQRPQRAPHCGG